MRVRYVQYYHSPTVGGSAPDPIHARHRDTAEPTAATAPYMEEAYRSRSQEGRNCRPDLTGGVPGFNGGVNGGTEPAPLKLNSDNTKDSQTLLLLVPVKTR